MLFALALASTAQGQTPALQAAALAASAPPPEPWLAERAAKFARMYQRRTREQTSITDAVSTIVMVSGNLAGASVFGAGILLGRRENSVFVATANHVVRRGDVVASELRLRLRDEGVRTRPATLLPAFDPRLDLAVMVLQDSANEIDVCGKDFRVLPTHELDRLGRGSSVSVVGNPNGRAWLQPMRGDAVIEADAERITFQSAVLSPGHSGGGLLGPREQLVGMVTADAPPFGAALPIEKLSQVVRSWGVPVQLNKRFRGAGEGFPYMTEGSSNDHELALVLARAAQAGDLASARKVLLESCEPERVMSIRQGHTPLHLAAGQGHLEMSQLLLSVGAEVDATNFPRRDTALHLAVAAGHIEVVRALLDAGADLRRRNTRGQGVLAQAAEGSAVAELLRARGAKE